MADHMSQSEADCSCPVCCDIFKDPVLLLCGHSFCKHCLKEWWKQSQLQTCPVCKEIFPMSQPPCNLALRNLSETLRQEKSKRATSGSTEICKLHNEKLKLFCQNDQQLVCVICRDAQKHKKHNCVPINEAAEDHRTKLKVGLMNLKSKLGSFQKQKLSCDEMASHIKLQAERTEKTIRGQFQKLYQFLRAEEATRIDSVRKEAILKREAMNIRTVNLNAEIATLKDKIKTIEGEMRADDFSFMTNVKSTLKQSRCNLLKPETPSGALIDEAKHVGNLLNTVWKRMKGIIKSTPVTLDPNTSGTNVILSENFTHLSESHVAQQLPNNPERESNRAVLGYQSFSSGEHSWDVEVDGFWAVGVAVRSKHETSARIWGIYTYGPGDFLFELINDARITSITRDLYPKKIRVKLDYDQGLLSFFDLDRKTPIHTIRHLFTKPVFPYFCATVKILPAEVTAFGRITVSVRKPR